MTSRCSVACDSSRRPSKGRCDGWKRRLRPYRPSRCAGCRLPAGTTATRWPSGRRRPGRARPRRREVLAGRVVPQIGGHERVDPGLGGVAEIPVARSPADRDRPNQTIRVACRADAGRGGRQVVSDALGERPQWLGLGQFTDPADAGDAVRVGPQRAQHAQADGGRERVGDARRRPSRRWCARRTARCRCGSWCAPGCPWACSPGRRARRAAAADGARRSAGRRARSPRPRCPRPDRRRSAPVSTVSVGSPQTRPTASQDSARVGG